MHYPQKTEDKEELSKYVAIVYAQAVTAYIEKLFCPKAQKLELYDELIRACLIC